LRAAWLGQHWVRISQENLVRYKSSAGLTGDKDPHFQAGSLRWLAKQFWVRMGPVPLHMGLYTSPLEYPNTFDFHIETSKRQRKKSHIVPFKVGHISQPDSMWNARRLGH
jgi:hypothetical protein